MKRIDILDPSSLAGTRIIKADQLAQMMRVHSVLAEAEAWAIDRKASLADEIEQERRAAYANAYGEGLSEFAKAISMYDEKAEALSLRVLDLVRVCLSRVLSNLPQDEVLHDLIAPVVRDIRSDQEVMILVHPDSLSDLKAAIARSTLRLPQGTALTPRADPAVDRADCLIYTEEEVFNVSIPVACDLLCRALSERLTAETADVG
jgi:flagellar biosynthesis/type III secretory pathway protein FliH